MVEARGLICNVPWVVVVVATDVFGCWHEEDCTSVHTIEVRDNTRDGTCCCPNDKPGTIPAQRTAGVLIDLRMRLAQRGILFM